MAIREYGESLLQDVRDRKQAEAQRIRKRQKRGELLGLAGMGLSYLGASKMKSQWDTFTKNEDVMNTNIMINSATNIDKSISELTKNIKDSGKSQQDYFLDKNTNETLDKLLLEEKNIKYNKNKESREAFKSAFAPEIRELQDIKDATKKSLELYNSSVIAQERFKASGTKKDAEKLSKERLGNRITSLFNQGDKQQEAVESFRNSLYAKSAGDLAIFDQLLKETGDDYVKSIELSEEFKLNENVLKQLEKINTQVEIGSNGKGIVVTTTENPVTGEKEIVNHKNIDLRTDEDKVIALKNLRDPTKELLGNINEEGQKEARNQGFKMYATDTTTIMNNYEILNGLYDNYTKIELSQKEAEKNKVITAFYSSDGYQEVMSAIRKAGNQITRQKNILRSQNPDQTSEQLENIYRNNNQLQQHENEYNIQFQNKITMQKELQEMFPSMNAFGKITDTEKGSENFGESGVKTGSTGTGSESNVLTDVKTNNTQGFEPEILKITDEEVANYKNRFRITDVSDEDIRVNDKESLENYTIKQRENKEYKKQSRIRVADRDLNILKNKAREKLNVKIEKELTEGEQRIYNKTKKYPSRILEKYKTEFEDLGQI